MRGCECWDGFGAAAADYNLPMLDEQQFRKHADSALEALKQNLIVAEESAEIEVEDQAGALHISFDDDSKFESHHYAFHVTNREFDAILGRIKKAKILSLIHI